MVSFFTTCMGRLYHLKETFFVNLPLIQSIGGEWVILDYHSKDELEEWIKERPKESIIYAKTTRPKFYLRSHSRNVAALLTTGNIICNLDADNFLSEEFIELVKNLAEGEFLQPPPGDSGTGRVVLYKDHFIKLGGYDERMEGYGYEDVDLVVRCTASGLKPIKIPPEILSFVIHGNFERTENEQNKDLDASVRFNEALSNESAKNNELIANVGKTWGRELVTINDEEKWVGMT